MPRRGSAIAPLPAARHSPTSGAGTFTSIRIFRTPAESFDGRVREQSELRSRSGSRHQNRAIQEGPAARPGGFRSLFPLRQQGGVRRRDPVLDRSFAACTPGRSPQRLGRMPGHGAQPGRGGRAGGSPGDARRRLRQYLGVSASLPRSSVAHRRPAEIAVSAIPATMCRGDGLQRRWRCESLLNQHWIPGSPRRPALVPPRLAGIA